MCCWDCCGAVHPSAERATLYLFAERASVHQPAIAVCFIFGILWPRLNGQGAISSLLVGFVLGAARFVLEVVDKSGKHEWALSNACENELSPLCHFYVCGVLDRADWVSMMYPALDRKNLQADICDGDESWTTWMRARRTWKGKPRRKRL